MNRIHAAKMLQRFFHRRLHLLIASDIANDSHVIRTKLRRDRFNSLPVAGGDHYFCAFVSVGLGAVTPNAAGSAGEKNDFVFEKRSVHGKKRWQKPSGY